MQMTDLVAEHAKLVALAADLRRAIRQAEIMERVRLTDDRDFDALGWAIRRWWLQRRLKRIEKRVRPAADDLF